VFDRRFLIEEGFEPARRELVQLIERALDDTPGVEYQLRDLMIVHPTKTPDGSPLVRALDRAILKVLDRPAQLVASPGTYDQKHFARIAGISHCVAYGPGELQQAHQVDEWCRVDDIVNAAKVIALATLDLMQAATDR
jgi:succinyl-diaminopimelate desuccinylase